MKTFQPFHIVSTAVVLLAFGPTSADAERPRPAEAGATTDQRWGRIVRKESSLELHVTELPADRKLSIPRLNNRMKRLFIEGEQGESADETKLGFRPEIKTWQITVPEDLNLRGGRIVFETIEPVLLPEQADAISQADDGSITLPAHHAITHGTLLRYEPQPHKNTVGYWADADDWAQWNLSVSKPMTFEVEVLQGCGKGHGGSTVSIELADQKCEFVVEDTGHFQNFKPRRVGTLHVNQPGVYVLELRAVEKIKGAVCDVRQIRLLPVQE